MADQQPTLQTPSSAPSKGKKKLKSSTVKDAISKTRTIMGGPQDQININPIQEAAEKHAVFAFGRFNPPTVGHEKLIHKVESTAKDVGGEAHIIASHSEGSSKNPVPAEKKTGYLKKVASSDTHVSTSSSEKPSLLHHLTDLHNKGVKHLTMVAGSDRVDQYKEVINKYNGQKNKHGFYNFKSVNVVSAGHRDPDAEGATGMSGTKMRELARSGDKASFKKGLPKQLHPHAEEIMNHIKSVKEDINIDDAFEFFMFAESVNLNNAFSEAWKDDENPDPKYKEAVPRSGQERKKIMLVPRDDADRKDCDRPYRLQSIVKKIIDEKYGKGYQSPASKIEKAMKDRGYSPNSSDEYRKKQQETDAAYKAILDKEKEAKKDVKESTSTSDIPVWEKPGPKGKSKKLTAVQKARAKARAKAAGRPYPNLVDNMAVSKE